jgi:hypothetical protein
MFKAAPGNGLEMKFAFYGADNAAGVRRCQITKRWITDANDMAATIERNACDCGCFVHVRTVLAQAVKEAADRPLRAVVILGDAFHDDADGLDEAALFAIRLRRAGTQVFFLQLSDDPDTARKLQHLARLSGAAYLPFGAKQEREFAAMWEAIATFTAGGEEAVQKMGGHAAPRLLQHLKQEPMPIVEKRDRVAVSSVAAIGTIRK